MKGLLAILASILLAMVCWGIYGPLLDVGQAAMESRVRPFLCVGLAYFVIAVIVPSIVLRAAPEAGQWTASGIFWSLAASEAGALGALGIVLALSFRGNPVYVMPLVFGGAPVVNTMLTMYWARSFRQVGPVFLAGLILVLLGAVTVLVFRPRHGGEAAALEWADLALVFLFTAMTALSWGVYGPMLHKGQAAMGGSRLRPFLCVGVAYFLIAVLVPAVLLAVWNGPGEFTFRGSLWSLAGGAAGAVGALGIIMAFNSGGKPIYVMPLVFGGAPIVNTLVSLAKSGGFEHVGPMFCAGLILSAAGAVVVLVFAPKPDKKPAAGGAEQNPAAETAHA